MLYLLNKHMYAWYILILQARTSPSKNWLSSPVWGIMELPTRPLTAGGRTSGYLSASTYPMTIQCNGGGWTLERSTLSPVSRFIPFVVVCIQQAFYIKPITGRYHFIIGPMSDFNSGRISVLQSWPNIGPMCNSYRITDIVYIFIGLQQKKRCLSSTICLPALLLILDVVLLLNYVTFSIQSPRPLSRHWCM